MSEGVNACHGSFEHAGRGGDSDRSAESFAAVFPFLKERGPIFLGRAVHLLEEFQEDIGAAEALSGFECEGGGDELERFREIFALMVDVEANPDNGMVHVIRLESRFD
jgi:hypothetical protein